MTSGGGGALRGRAVLAAAAVLCLVTGTAYVVLGPRPAPNPDFRRFYRPVAERILDGAGPTREDGSAAVRYPPGYPTLLAAALGAGRALGASEGAATRGLQVAAFAAAGVLLAALGRRVRAGPAALLAPAAWALYPLALHLTGSGSSDLPFVPLFLGAALALQAWGMEPGTPRAGRMAAVGLLAGLAMLTRPIAIGLAGVFALVLWAARRDLPRARRAALVGALLAGSLVAVLPWSIWASADRGRVVVLSTGGPATVRDGLTYAIGNTAAGRPPARVPDDVRALQAGIWERPKGGFGAVARAFAAEAAERPAAAAKLVAIKAVGAWYATDSRRHQGPALAIQLAWLVAIGVAARRAARGTRAARRLTGLAAVVALYFWGMTVVGLSIVRYMVPAMALLMALLPALARERDDRAEA